LKKNIIVTGASRGLGLGICERLFNEKYRIIGIGRTDPDEFKSPVLDVNKDNFFYKQFDLNNLPKIHNLLSEIINEYGPIYGLVNNAAIGIDGVLATMHHKDISQLLKTNLEVPILMAKFACRSMLLNGQGRIVNISSIISKSGFNGLSVYAATKAGLNGFTKSLARELGRYSITVNTVEPGFMSTQMTTNIASTKLESIKRRAPLGLVEPNDVAGAVAYLLSPDGSMITGTTITVDGGSTS
jgi:3-oxoacyl-[acyl-carrier protein] reductase